MILNHLKTAVRNIRFQRGTSMINIGGLAIGMWAAILIFIWVQNELSFDKHHKDAGNIYLVKNYIGLDQPTPSVWENSPYLLGQKAQEQLPEILKVTRIAPSNYQDIYFNIKGNFTKESRGAYVDSTWFNFFPSKVISGSIAAFNENPYSLILTEKIAKKYFGNENPVGETIRIDSNDYRVQAVIADNPTYSSFQSDIFFPLSVKMLSAEGKRNQLSWGNYNYQTFVKLTPIARVKTVEEKLSSLVIKERKREKIDMKAGLISLSDMHFDKSIDNPAMLRGEKKSVIIFSVLGILLLAIACINYVNLTTARATLRIKEVSIKKIVGAERKQLFFQFVIESFLISLASLIIAILAIYVSLPFFNKLTDKQFSLTANSTAIAMVALGTMIVSVILSSLYPALLLSSFKPVAIFSGRNVFSIKSGSLRKILVTTQFTLSILLIIATIIVYRQMQFINRESSTYNKEQIFSFSIPYKIYRQLKPEERINYFSTIQKELLAQSSIDRVCRFNGGSLINMTSWSSGGSDWEGRPKDFEPKISFFETDTSFLGLLNLQMAEGRWFLPTSADQHNSIVNETAVKELNLSAPVIGKRFIARGDTGIIVGVVKDFYYRKLNEKTGPVVINNNQQYATTFFVKSIAGRTMEAKNAAEKIWKGFVPNEPFPYKFLNDEFETLYRTEQNVFLLVQIFSSLAIFISCLGLFGLAAFTAERRRKEIGVRKVIGASVMDIVSLISRDSLQLVGIAFVIASPLAWWAMDNWLQDFAYRTSIAWWIFAVAGSLTILVAIVTLSYHAIKAATANPVRSLRSE